MLALRPLATDGFTSTHANSGTRTFKRRRHSISTSTLRIPKPADALTDSSLRKLLPPTSTLTPTPTRNSMRRPTLPLPMSPTKAKKLASDGPRRHSFLNPPTSRSGAMAAPVTIAPPSTASSPVKVLCASHPHSAIHSPVHGPLFTTVSTKPPSSTPSSTPSSAPPSTPRELPILRHSYTARDVRVAIGPSWRLQRFDIKSVRLVTGAAPTIHILSTPTPTKKDADDLVFTMPHDTVATIQSGHGLKLKSHTNNQLRLRIRFSTAADATIWRRLIQDALTHAASVATVDQVRCLSLDCMSRVVVVRHRQTQQERVVKVLQNLRVDDGHCDEVAILKKLFPLAHANKSLAFLADYSVVETDKDVHIVMPMHPGKTLLQFLSDRPKPHTLTEVEARMTTWRICEELHALHVHKIIHCDLKLENVLVTADASDARVIDFGGAYDGSKPHHQPQSTKLIGTPGYIAPERILHVDDPPTPAADLFSLGILLFQMLVGQHPYQGRRRLTIQDSLAMDWDHMHRQLEHRRVASEAQELIHGLVAKDPHDRTTLDQVFHHTWFATH